MGLGAKDIGNRQRTPLAWGAKGQPNPAIRLLDMLPNHPLLTLARAIKLLRTTKPTAAKAIGLLCQAKILRETTGKARDRVMPTRVTSRF